MNYIHVYLYMEYESILLESNHMNRNRENVSRVEWHVYTVSQLYGWKTAHLAVNKNHPLVPHSSKGLNTKLNNEEILIIWFCYRNN
jgi:hypothetical protein